MKYQPELDGLRALAVIAVVVFHCGGPLKGGFVGVDLFFVLSAYLISSKLAEDRGLASFYWRRFCRLMPALLFMLAGYLAVAPWVWTGYPHARDALVAGLYLSDYSFALFRVPLFIQHTWSLAIEEHFYLLFPFAFVALRKAKQPLAILAVAYIAMTLWRIPWGWHQYYYRFDTHATGLILGAMLFFRKPKLSKVTVYAAFTVLALVCVVGQIDHSMFTITLAEICAAALITNPPRWLASSALTWIGKRSYAIYLWHYPIAYALRGEFGFPVTALLTIPSSIALASLSYVTVEAWGHKLRHIVPTKVRERSPPEVTATSPNASQIYSR